MGSGVAQDLDLRLRHPDAVGEREVRRQQAGALEVGDQRAAVLLVRLRAISVIALDS